MNPPTWTDQLSAWSTLATAVLTAFLFVAALVAWRTASATLGAAKLSAEAAVRANEQSQRDSIEQTRPYVYAEVTPGLAGVGSWDLRISNNGRSAARGLTLAFDQWPDELDDIAEGLRAMFEIPRTLPPGCTIRTMWRLTGNFTDGSTEAGLGQAGQITVAYASDDPADLRYNDTFDVTIANSGDWPVGESGFNADGLDARDRKFYSLGQAVARHIAELRR